MTFGKRGAAPASGFGKRGHAPEAPLTELAAVRGPAPRLRDDSLPWTRTAAEPAAERAIRELGTALLAHLKGTDGQAALGHDTLLLVIGALAGLAAQHALWETAINAATVQFGREVHAIETADGRTYYFGDALNAFLIPEDARHKDLWSLLTRTAYENGVSFRDIPDYAPIFARASETIGTSAFGDLTGPGQPKFLLTPLQALRQFWPLAHSIFTRAQVPPAFWPAVTGVVAQEFMVQVRLAVPPRAAMLTVMSAAVPMSKLDPRSLPPAPSEPPRMAGPTTVKLARGPKNMFRTEITINAVDISVLVDTGAPSLALSSTDAAAIGLTFQPGDFTLNVVTAHGPTRAAPAFLPYVDLKGIRVRNVAATVALSDSSHETVLGKSFLGKLRTVAMTSGHLVLED